MVKPVVDASVAEPAIFAKVRRDILLVIDDLLVVSSGNAAIIQTKRTESQWFTTENFSYRTFLKIAPKSRSVRAMSLFTFQCGHISWYFKRI
jgi:hypothetical protein